MKNNISPSNTSTIYRKTKFGECIEEGLEDMVKNSRINQDKKKKILDIFDQVICAELSNKSKDSNNRNSVIKGKVKSYKNVDDVWVFDIEGATIKQNESENMSCDNLKIIAYKKDVAKENIK